MSGGGENPDMRIRVLRDRILTPEDRRTSVRFVAGWEGTTKRVWGEALVKDGDAEEIGVPVRASRKASATDAPAD